MKPLSPTEICSCYLDGVPCLQYLHKVDNKKEGGGGGNAKNLTRSLSKARTSGRKGKRTRPLVNQVSYLSLCNSRNIYLHVRFLIRQTIRREDVQELSRGHSWSPGHL